MAEEADSVELEVERDIEFASVDGISLRLDIHRIRSEQPTPVVLYLHGGAWQVGDKADEHGEARIRGIAGHGIAVASVNYRLVSQARYPAQVHDVKAAVRWLRARGAAHGLDVGRIGVWGASAGGYLAAMVGLTAGDEDLEGNVGDDAGASSAVDVVVDWFGPADLVVNSRRSGLERELLAAESEPLLLGLDAVSDDVDAARWASPLWRARHDAPPFLIAHGDADRITPIGESASLHSALTRLGAASTFVILGGAGHEGAAFDGDDHLRMTAAFLASHLT